MKKFFCALLLVSFSLSADEFRDFENVILIAYEAGEAILEIYNSANFEIEFKEDNSPLTKADKAAHKIISKKLLSLTPSIPLVSEEGRRGDPLTSDYVWLVDPLDGTKEFIKRNGMFTVNIALMKKNGNRWNPIFGVVYAPALSKCWVGGKDFPAQVRDSSGARIIKVTHSIPSPIRLVTSLSHGGKQDELFAKLLGKHSSVQIGSSLKACIVAEGKAELYPRFGPTNCWDIAAAHAVVQAAGGIVVDPFGNSLDYNVTGNTLNPYFLIACSAYWNTLWTECQK